MCQTCDHVYDEAVLDGNFSFLTQMDETHVKLETAIQAAASVTEVCRPCEVQRSGWHHTS
jgi:rubredoxin